MENGGIERYKIKFRKEGKEKNLGKRSKTSNNKYASQIQNFEYLNKKKKYESNNNER